nr:glyoxalase [Providencia stuartii]ELR5083911.1 glyoxalase [Providencia stuartii]
MFNPAQDSEVLFVAGFGPITRDSLASRHFYQAALGLPLQEMEGNSDYLTCEEEQLGGINHFAVWPLEQVAQSCFGQEHWPKEHIIPQSWIEFEVASLSKATQNFIDHGYSLLINQKIEPWGQTVTRLLSPEGILVSLTITPWLRE